MKTKKQTRIPARLVREYEGADEFKAITKKPTLTEFISQTHIPARLVRGVVREYGGIDEFKAIAEDVQNHGANSGAGGAFIYYRETVPFAKKYKKEILAMAEELAQDIGEGDAFQLIAGFNCLKCDKLTAGQVAEAVHKSRGTDNTTSVLNALAWCAAEEVSRAWCDYVERLKD